MAQKITITIGNGNGNSTPKPKRQSAPRQNFGPIWNGSAFGGHQLMPSQRPRRRRGFSVRAATSDIKAVRGLGRQVSGAGRDVVGVGRGAARGGRAVVSGGRSVVRGGRAAVGFARSVGKRLSKPKKKSFPKVTSKEFQMARKTIPKIENRGPKPVQKQSVRDLERKRRSISAFDRAAAGKL